MRNGLPDLDRYLFDLRGYLVLRNAVSKNQVAAMNDTLDQMPDMEPGDWYGYVHRENFEASRGIAYPQIYEAGAPFEALIGGEGTFDYNNGELFIDESFVSIRGPGDGASVDGVEGAIEVHLDAGDAILFVDALSHGSAKRVNEGERRILVYRYGPAWATFRFPYWPSPELLSRYARRQSMLTSSASRSVDTTVVALLAIRTTLSILSSGAGESISSSSFTAISFAGSSCRVATA